MRPEGCKPRIIAERGGAGFDYAIDRVWKRLQQQMFFALTKERFARQRPSFSDIENSHQDYGL
jgi:hypothetical protein